MEIHNLTLVISVNIVYLSMTAYIMNVTDTWTISTKIKYKATAKTGRDNVAEKYCKCPYKFLGKNLESGMK